MKKTLLIALSVLVILNSCYRMRTSRGGGQIEATTARRTSASDILVHPGYKIELLSQGFTFPSALAFDDSGRLYILEAGYCYGEVWEEPRLIRADSDGSSTVIARGSRNGPWNGVIFHNGNFYVSEGGEAEGGKILRISESGQIETLVDGLPSVGDHHTNGLVIKDDYIYFGQGTATNSAVVGEDNAKFGWLKRKPTFHDIPCRDIVLSGENYESENVLTAEEGDTTSTGAYLSFGTPSSEGQVIEGRIPCTGAVLRVPLDGGNIEMVSWGLRNPFGIALSPEGRMYITENGYDERGSRPVWGTGDVLWEVQENTWYGWPDFAEGRRIATDNEFTPPSGKDPIKPLLKEYPNEPPRPVAVFAVHSSANGFDFSHSEDFGFQGEAFVAQFGDMAPDVGKVLAPVGFNVVRVNVESGVIRDFAVNRGKKSGPATWLTTGGLERPVAVKFSPDGAALYIVDFGILRMTENGPAPQVKTGVVWRITKE